MLYNLAVIHVAYAIVVLECRNDVVHAPWFIIIVFAPYDNGQLCREVAHPDDVVTQKRRFANIGTRAPTCATPLFMCRADRADKNRIFLERRRQGACRSSLGLHRTNQHSAHVHRPLISAP
jgi:hypothetical protein